MRKIILIILFTLIYNVKAQKIPTYREVNVCEQEGMAGNFGFKFMGEKEYLSIIKDFEKKLKKQKIIILIIIGCIFFQAEETRQIYLFL